jgi:hypothetical protein
LAGNVAFYTWPSLDCPSAIGWREELVAVVGRPTAAVLRGKGPFAFVGMFPHHPLAEKGAQVSNRAGKRTLRPQRVLRGGRVGGVLSAAGTVCGTADVVPLPLLVVVPCRVSAKM